MSSKVFPAIILILAFSGFFGALYADRLNLWKQQPNSYITVINYTTNSEAQYASVYNGCLWQVFSCDSYSQNLTTGCNYLQKTNLSTGSVTFVACPEWTSQMYEAYVYDDMVFVPGGTRNSGACLDIFNATTLSEMAFIVVPSNVAAFTQAIYDPTTNDIVLGTDMENMSAGVWYAPLSDVTTGSAYSYSQAEVPTEAPCGMETTVTVFRGTLYAICTGPVTPNANQTITTDLEASTNLNNWTQVWEKQCYDYGPGAYFAHIASNVNWIVCGVIIGPANGSSMSTYRIEYSNGDGTWLEYNTKLPDTSAEDHPDVSLISANTCVFEYSQGGTASFPASGWDITFGADNHPLLYTYDFDNGAFTLIANLTGYGYNDRLITSYNNTIYVSDVRTSGSWWDSRTVAISLPNN